MLKLGAQLYTVRAHTQDLESFSETLKKVADIGYKYVQVSGTCDFDAQWLAQELKLNGLECPVTHTNPEKIAKETLEVAKAHEIFGAKIAGIGYPPGGFAEGYSSYEVFRDTYLPAAKTLAAQGLKLGHHNHAVEFQQHNGKTFLEYMANDFSKDELAIILDTFWVQFSGGTPANWLRTLKGYVSCIHLKDMSIIGNKQETAVIGEGNMDWDAVILACEDADTEYGIVEQDNCQGEDPFDCLKRSYKNLKSMGL